MTADRRYSPHLLVTVFSALENNQDLPLCINVCMDEADELVPVLQRICEHYGQAFRYVENPASRASKHPMNIKAGVAASSIYYRTYASDFLPRTMDRVLYLDSDLIVRRSLNPLYAEDLDGTSLGATACHSGIKDRRFLDRYGGRYFNSGVMLLNLAVWRERDIPRLCETFSLAHPELILFHDQCLLNYICDDWKWLNITWNFSLQVGVRWAPRMHVTKPQFERIAEDPAIFHFIGHVKPWKKPAAALNRFDREYYEYWFRLQAMFDVDLARYDRRPPQDANIATAQPMLFRL